MTAAVSRNDEFLFHLHRGSALLLDGDVHGAKVELEHALAFQPQDAKSQDLLAGVYFRLGLYPRAIDIWEALVDAFPAEPTLRINLGLAYFKTGQTAASREQLRAALRDAPEHVRAWGYLGLAEWRLGHLEAARDAFERGGQPAMVSRMEAALTGKASAPPAELPPELAGVEPEAQPKPVAPSSAAARLPSSTGDTRSFGTPPARPSSLPPEEAEAARPPDADAPGSSPAPPSGAHTAREAPASVPPAATSEPGPRPITNRLFAVPPAVRRSRRAGGVFEKPTAEDEAAHVATRASERAPAVHTAVTSPGAYEAPPRPAAPLRSPRPLDAVLAGAVLVPPPGETFAVAGTGELVVHATRPVSLRYAPLAALRGDLRLEALPRRKGGAPTEGPLGGDDAVMRWAAPLYALIEARGGRRFEVVHLAGASLYVRETTLFGFGEGVRYESATLRLEEDPVHVVKLEGEGHVVLQLRGALYAVPASAGEPLMVQPERVVGWSGRLFPSPRQGTAPYSASAPALVFRGEGAVLVGPPAESQ